MENNQSKMMSQEEKPWLFTVTPFSKYLALGLFVALPFLGGWVGYTYAPVKIVEIEKIVTVENEQVATPANQESVNRVVSAEVIDNEVVVTFADQTTKTIVRSVGFEQTDDIFSIETYLESAISPNGNYVALQGIEYEDYFVRVYNSVDDSLEEKIYGRITGWTADGKLQVNACNLAGEECISLISESAQTPSVMIPVTSN